MRVLDRAWRRAHPSSGIGAMLPIRRCCACGAPIRQRVSLAHAVCDECAERTPVHDVVVHDALWADEVRTAGLVIVEASGELVATRVIAGAGVIVRGVASADVWTGGCFRLAGGAYWRGDCTAFAFDIADGATVVGGNFHASSQPIRDARAFMQRVLAQDD